TGNIREDSWKQKAESADIFYLKGIVANLLRLLGWKDPVFETGTNAKLKNYLEIKMGKEVIAALGSVSKQELNRFDIKQEVFYADIHWKSVFEKSAGRPVSV